MGYAVMWRTVLDRADKCGLAIGPFRALDPRAQAHPCAPPIRANREAGAQRLAG